MEREKRKSQNNQKQTTHISNFVEYIEKRRLIKRLVYVVPDLRNNLYKDTVDAVGGIVVMLIMPLISLLGTFFWVITQNGNMFLSYVYPIMSMCFAGIYDSIGRLRDKPKPVLKKMLFRIIKLEARIAIDVIALIAAVFAAINHIGYLFAPGALTLLGSLLLYDAVKIINATRWTKDDYAQSAISDGF